MNEIKRVASRLIEFTVFLSIGLFFTMHILRPIYETFGIQFIGNVWMNWFGVSYILFVLYSVIIGLTLYKGSVFFRQRLTSSFFWFVFVGSTYVVFIPFYIGENPF